MKCAQRIRTLARCGLTREELIERGYSRQQIASALQHTRPVGRPRATCEACVCGVCGARYRPSRTRPSAQRAEPEE